MSRQQHKTIAQKISQDKEKFEENVNDSSFSCQANEF